MHFHKLSWLLLILVVSCSLGDIEQIHHDAVVDGYNQLPIAKSLHDRFGGWSFITHLNMSTRGYKDNEKEWHTKVFINDRYEVNYLEDVIIDKKTMKVLKPKGDGKLYIKELVRIYMDDGTLSVSPGDFQKVIEGDNLEKLAKANWDFSSIGFDLKTNPVENFQLWKDYWKQLYPKQ